MSQMVNRTAAMGELLDSLRRCREMPRVLCDIKPTIDFILGGKRCLTYRYILMTALVAKATNEGIDILSLQAEDSSEGAYDARSLCHDVVFSFQRDFLDDVLDGSNEDPLVNNPGRNLRIDRSNKAAEGDPKKALYALCDDLPKVKNASTARDCLDYLISRCLDMAEVKKQQADSYSVAMVSSDIFSARAFMDSLLDKNYGGIALLLVAHAIFSVLYPSDEGYSVVAHPVNQSGASNRQMGDIDIVNADGSSRLAIELKDRPFTAVEVSKAAKNAYEKGVPAMLFVAGRASLLTDDVHRYFNDAKAEYARKGMVIGVMGIDALVDYFFTARHDANASLVFSLIERTMVDVHATPEVISWVYRNAEGVTKGR